MYNDLFSIGPLTIHGYGLMIGLGSALAVIWSEQRAKRRSLSDDLTLELALWVIVMGFLSAKLLYILTRWREFLASPLTLLGGEGFVVFGGVLGALFTGFLRCRRAGADFAAYADVFMPPVALAQCLGRIGCFLAGCCYGRETASALGVVFPTGSLAPAGVPLLPVQLFSSALDLLLCAALLLWERRQKRPGELCAAYLLLYSLGRFAIEFLRGDPRGTVGPLSTSQFISLFVVLIGAVWLCLLRRRGHAES